MKDTKIQWCHSTVNPIMGCGGRELFSNQAAILEKIDSETGQPPGTADALSVEIIDREYREIQNPEPEHTRAVTTTNIWHARMELEAIRTTRFGEEIGRAARNAIKSSITCYEYNLHLNKALSIFNPTRSPNSGYAPVFERITRFPGEWHRLPQIISEFASFADFSTNTANNQIRKRSFAGAPYIPMLKTKITMIFQSASISIISLGVYKSLD